jgi:hypothetical protein
MRGETMKLGFVGTTSNDTGCPTLYVTDRGTIVVQGTTVADPEALAAMRTRGNGVPDHESAVEIPAALLPFVDVAALQRLAFADESRPEFVIDEAAAAAISTGH